MLDRKSLKKSYQTPDEFDLGTSVLWCLMKKTIMVGQNIHSLYDL